MKKLLTLSMLVALIAPTVLFAQQQKYQTTKGFTQAIDIFWATKDSVMDRVDSMNHLKPEMINLRYSLMEKTRTCFDSIGNEWDYILLDAYRYDKGEFTMYSTDDTDLVRRHYTDLPASEVNDLVYKVGSIALGESFFWEAMQEHKYYQRGLDLVNNVSAAPFLFTVDGREYLYMQLKKSISLHTPREIYWICLIGQDHYDGKDMTPQEQTTMRTKLAATKFLPFVNLSKNRGEDE